MGHRVPDFENTDFQIEIIGDTGSFAITDTPSISKIYRVGVPSIEDSLAFCGITLHLYLSISGGASDSTLTVSLAGSLDGTTADTVLPGGTFLPSLTITTMNATDDPYIHTRTYGMEDGLGAYVQFMFERTAGDRDIACVATARRWRWLEM